jgi:phenylacetate-coenzyme A ligase PaaK-like adenylate-forming protein
MNNGWETWIERAAKYELITPSEIETFISWGFSSTDYPLSIDKSRYRINNNYQQAVLNRKLYRFYGATTGSSGEPFVAITDFKTRFFRGYHWQKIMSELRGDSSLVLMWRNKSPSINQRQLIARGKLVLKPIYDLTGEKDSFLEYNQVQNTLKSLPKNRSLVFRSYVSVLVYLAKNFTKELRSLNIKRVIASGEMLSTRDWNLIESTFNCPCVNVYGGTEASPMAISSDSDRRLKIQDKLFHIGCIQDGGSSRIVVTDKINRVLPIFSYDIGDRTSGVEIEDGATYLKDVIGRTSEIIKNSFGNEISSHFIHVIFREELEVSKYRIFDRGVGEVEIILELGKEANSHKIEERITTKFNNLGFRVSSIKKSEIPMLIGLKHRTIVRDLL